MEILLYAGNFLDSDFNALLGYIESTSVHLTMMVCNKLLLIFLGLLSSTTLVDARVRGRRANFGHIYKEHDQSFQQPNRNLSLLYSLPFCHEHHSTEEEKEEENEAAAAAAEEDVEISGADESVNKRQGRLRHKQRFGESMIVGDRRGETSPYEIAISETSPYEISFLDSVDWRLLCKKFTAEGRSAEAEGYLLF
eukprot:scaffold8850_cov64-Cylindrotheca_fusiformis.AAC.2